MESTPPAAPETPPAPAGATPVAPASLGVILSAGLAGLAPGLDQLWLTYQGLTHEVTHLQALPLAWVWAPLTLAQLGLVGLALASRKPGPKAVRTRLPGVGAAIQVFAFIFVTPAVRPLTPSLEPVAAVQALGEILRGDAEQAGQVELPVLPGLLDVAVKELPSPNLFVKGEPVKAWTWVLRENCTGPVTEAAGAGPGTFFYCLSADHKTAWLTVVMLGAELYGDVKLATRNGHLVEFAVHAPPPRPPPSLARPDPEPPDEAPPE
jgi:hypothetical protein